MEKSEKAVPKFTTVFSGSFDPDNVLLDRLMLWCSKFHDTGLAPCYGEGTFGNLSYRKEKGKDIFVITASAVGLKDKLTMNEFAEVETVDLKNKIVQARGIRNPSSESMLHHAIYKQRNDVHAIFHGHCEKILNSCDRLNIRSTEKEEPYGSLELVNKVLAITSNNDFVIMKEHGFISLGKDMEQAGRQALDYLSRC